MERGICPIASLVLRLTLYSLTGSQAKLSQIKLWNQLGNSWQSRENLWMAEIFTGGTITQVTVP